MLSKLAFRNVKRSAKDYVIYLITVTLAFSFIFAFNLMGNSEEILNLCDVMNNFALVMYFVNAFIIVVVCFLINYTVKFMFSKRSKEFGTYMLLGIKKKKISKMFTFENIILGFFSLFISIPIGYIFSLFMSFIVTRMFELDSIVKITFNLNSVLLLLLYFVLIYLFVLFLARHRIKKVKIYDLLYLEKQNEEKRFKKNKVRNVAFIVSLIVGVVAMYEENQILPLPQMYGKNLTFKTGGVDAVHCAKLLEMISNGLISTDFLITHKVSLENIKSGYEIFENKQNYCLKVAVVS